MHVDCSMQGTCQCQTQSNQWWTNTMHTWLQVNNQTTCTSSTPPPHNRCCPSCCSQGQLRRPVLLPCTNNLVMLPQPVPCDSQGSAALQPVMLFAMLRLLKASERLVVCGHSAQLLVQSPDAAQLKYQYQMPASCKGTTNTHMLNLNHYALSASSCSCCSTC